ncbi:hypothetical protein [Flavobacterium sp.]|jgi:hypothetical protein|uniref:hypothetical protein n=1 Tax=Flavobacterium sp. TaxID=239 RepID=UPI0037C12F53
MSQFEITIIVLLTVSIAVNFCSLLIFYRVLKSQLNTGKDIKPQQYTKTTVNPAGKITTNNQPPDMCGFHVTGLPDPEPVEFVMTKQMFDKSQEHNQHNSATKSICKSREHVWTDPYHYENGSIQIVDSYCTVCGTRANGSGQ